MTKKLEPAASIVSRRLVVSIESLCLWREWTSAMFEGKVLELVKKYLDRYVENLDSDVLQVGLFSGN